MAEDEGKSKAGGPKPDKGEAAQPAESAWTALLKAAGGKLVPLIVSAGGLLGFVAFAGSVVLWTRFSALHVPPDQVVDAVPRGEAVAIGGSMLLLFGFFGAIATLAAYLIDRGGRATPGMSRGLLLILTVEGAAAIWIAGDKPVEERVIASEVLLLAFGAILWSTFVGELIRLHGEIPDLDGDEKPQQLPARAFRRENGKSGVERSAVLVALGIAAGVAALVFLGAKIADRSTPVAWILALAALGLLLLCAVGFHWYGFERREAEKRREAQEKREELAKTAAEAEAALPPWRRRLNRWRRDARKRWNEKRKEKKPQEEERRKPPRFEFTFWGLLLVVPLTAALVAIPALIMREWWLAVSLGSVVMLGAGLWRVADLSKDRFIWYGLAIFISVPLFGTLMLMARNIDNPQVQPVALIRSSDGPAEALQGLYVTEAAERVYFASVATEGCENDVIEDSGRLLWVPKDEVVAMSIGPLQDVDDAGRSALEMAYALTPDVETPDGALVSLAVKGQGKEEGASGKKASKGGDGTDGDAGEPKDGEKGGKGSNDEKGQEGSTDAPEVGASDGHRLESTGPAVRPGFGAGLKLVPASAEPGQIVDLRMSVPNPNPEVNGFGASPEGHNLRLNGKRLAILRVPARSPAAAEYVKTVDGAVLPLKRGEGSEFVWLEKGSVTKVRDGDSEGGFSLLLDTDGRLALHKEGRRSKVEVPPSVTLPNGREVQLRRLLLRRAWSPTRVKFRVPEDATTGVVAVECGQLAGQPVLTVVQPPTARVTVRMRTGSQRVAFDSSRSTDETEGELTRRWTVAGRAMGGESRLPVFLQSRLRPYAVSLTVADEDGQSDTVGIRLLRLPSSRFRFGSNRPRNRKAVRRVRKAVREGVEEEAPAAIELHGHADAVGSNAINQTLSEERVERMREELFAPAASHGAPIPMTVRAFGETCPIVPSSGRKAVNRRVEVFLLGPGAIVATPSSCRPGHIRRSSW